MQIQEDNIKIFAGLQNLTDHDLVNDSSFNWRQYIVHEVWQH